jgi:hypothetical protein
VSGRKARAPAGVASHQVKFTRTHPHDLAQERRHDGLTVSLGHQPFKPVDKPWRGCRLAAVARTARGVLPETCAAPPARRSRRMSGRGRRRRLRCRRSAPRRHRTPTRSCIRAHPCSRPARGGRSPTS